MRHPRPLKLYDKMERDCSKIINYWFDKHIKPKIVKAMKPLKIKRIENQNAYTIFTLEDGSVIFDVDFNDKQTKFYNRYLVPLADRYHVGWKVDLDIKA